MRRILITRPEPDATRFAEKCANAGLVPLVAPLSAVRFRDKPLPKDEWSGVAFTSANGVRAFSRLSGDRSVAAFCVGEATAAEARAIGFDNIHTAHGDISALAEMIAANVNPGGKILHAAGARRAGDLEELLASDGIRVRLAVLYDITEEGALPAAAVSALQTGEVQIPLFSAAGARLFVRLVEEANLTSAISACCGVFISDAVSASAGSLPWLEKNVAASKTSAAMITLLTQRA